MTTAIIGTGGIGSVIARRLASGGEALRLSSVDTESARAVAAEIGRTAVVAVDNRDALQGADTVVLALRFAVLKGVIDEIAGPPADTVVVVPSNPVGLDAQGSLGTSPARKANPPARLSPGGCRQRRAWPWCLEPVCRASRVLQQPISGAGVRSSTPPTTAVPARKSSGGSERPASSL